MKIRIKNYILVFTLLFLMSSVRVLQAQTPSYPYTCSFENGLDGWENAAGQANQWTIGRGDAAHRTNSKSFETGPESAHDGNAYAYVNLFDKYTGRPVTLTKTFDFSTLTNPLISLYLHNYWNDGEGSTFTVKTKLTSEHENEWKTYNYVTSGGNQWNKLNVCMSDYAGASGVEIRLIIDPRNGVQPNIAIDDIRIEDFTISTSQTDITCFGYDDGAITVTPAGAGPVYKYFDIRDGSTPIEFSREQSMKFPGLAHGIYHPKVQDSLSECYATLPSVTLYQPSEIKINTYIDDIECYGDLDGSITIGASQEGGSETGYQFSINGGLEFQSNCKFENKAGGKYEIVVKNETGCLSKPVTAEIGANVLLEITGIDVINVDRCHGDKTGSFVVNTAFGNNAPINFSLDGGATLNGTQEKFTGLAAGTYQVTAIDRKGCKIQSDPITITEPPLLELKEITKKDVIGCNGQKNGSIDIALEGGTGEYYTTINGIAFRQQTHYEGLSAGTYYLAAYDGKNCQINLGETYIEQPPVLEISKVTVNDVTTCHGDATGSLEITAHGGTAPLIYHLNAERQTIEPTLFNKIPGLLAGKYVPYVTDSQGCLATYQNNANAYVTITEPEPFQLSSVSSFDNEIRCHGDIKGGIYAVASGGTLPYHFTIDDYAHSTTLKEMGTCSFTPIGAGTYTVKAKDDKGCPASDTTVTLHQLDPITILSVETTPLSCYKNSTGAIEITATGGTNNFKYGYSIHGDDNYRTTIQPTIVDLPSDIYDISVTDDNGCAAYSYNHIVAEPDELRITEITPQDVSICYGSNNGSIIINAMGGTKPYKYSIYNGAEPQESGYFGNLPSDNNYHVIVTDANGCLIDGGGTLIRQPEPVEIQNFYYSDVKGCNGSNTGEIHCTASGGTGQLSFTITGFPKQYTGDFEHIPAGTYKLRAEDTHGCAKEMSNIIINQPEILEFTDQNKTTDNLCFGENKGEAIITVSGGMPIQKEFPYKFFLNLPDGAPTDGNPYCYDGIFRNLYAGDYNITICDAYNCTIKTSFTITEPDLFEIKGVDTVNVNTCNGDQTGSIKINITGGTQPITFTASSRNGYYSQNNNGLFQQLGATQYELTAEDANKCLSQYYTEIQEPTRLTFEAKLTKDIICHDSGEGEIHTTATGGVGQYQTSIDGGKTFPYPIGTITGIKPGKYTIKVKDQNGCVSAYDRNITIQNPPALSITATASDVICHSGNTGKIIVSASGGTKPYEYSIDNTEWHENQTVFDELTDGQYTIYVKDLNNCKTQTNPLTINRPANKAEFTTDKTEGCSPLEIIITQKNSGISDYIISNGDRIYDRLGPTRHTIKNNTDQIQKYEIIGTLTYNDGIGCSDTASTYVTVYPQPKVDFRLSDTTITWPNNTINFANLSKNRTTTHWDFGDGTTSERFDETSHTYKSCGYYNIRLIESDGLCSDTLEQILHIEGREIKPSFTTSAHSGCEPATITFNNQSENADSILWDFGDGSLPVANSHNTKHTYKAPGTYKATLTLYGDCGTSTTTSQTITIYPKPTAAFEQNTDTIYADQTLRVYCQSSPTDKYIWDFGDGTQIQGLSTAEHKYKFDGTFDISLIVVTGNSCSDTATVKKAVVVATTPIIVFPTAFTPNNDGLNDRFLPVHGHISTYEIIILDRKGVVVYRSTDIDEGWDGTRNGKPCLPGMYVYKAKSTLRDKTIHYQYGHVMMYR